LAQAEREVPGIYDVVVGVCWLGVRMKTEKKSGSHDRPYSTREIFRLLRTLRMVTTESVMAAAACKEANAKKIATRLGIASREVAALLPQSEPQVGDEMPRAFTKSEIVQMELDKLEGEMHYLEDWKDDDFNALADEWDASDGF
jgi:hypothetical protein